VLVVCVDEGRFYEHVKKYDLVFEDGTEFVHRLEVFALLDDRISSHNSGNSTYSLGHNEYSHLTWKEFSARFNLGKPLMMTVISV
jgi:hypothetical protein